MLSEQMESKCLEFAMLWLLCGALLLGSAEWCEGCVKEERVALAQIKHLFPFIDSYTVDLGGPELDQYYGNESIYDDCCQWERVECNPISGRVTHLFLDRTDMSLYDSSWYLNASLFLPFQDLQSLSLSGNGIAGCVSDQGFESLSLKLEILDLSYNYFNDSILTSISQLSSLKSLSLKGNHFRLSNPTTGLKMLSKLNNLEILDLSGNTLGNSILSQLHDFTSLKSLKLEGCGLKGTINLLDFNTLINLKELYLGFNEIKSMKLSLKGKGQLKLDKLEVLDLSFNQFTNDIFSSIVALSNLKSLDLSENVLNGPIDIKDLNAFSNLEELRLRGNDVTELVPSQDITLTKLKALDLGYNPMDTRILETLRTFPNLNDLSLGFTQLNESINMTEMLDLSNLETLSMDCYPDKRCNISSQSLSLFSSLKTLYLDGFNFKGRRIHSQSQNKWQNLTNLEELELSDSSLPSSFIGNLPSLKQLYIFYCYLEQDNLVIQEPFKLKNLEILDIDGMLLGNNFLQNFGTMPSLKSLRLWDCELNDTLHNQDPLNLDNLEFLKIYNSFLGNNFFQKLVALPSLNILRLFECGLNDTFQSQGICGFTNLRTLDLSNNQLKGNLPECFSNFTSLESLDLSSSQFSGTVSILQTLSSLKNLKLSNNYFQIPSSLRPFFNLSKLEHFDVDNNIIYTESERQSSVPRFQLNEISLTCCGDAGQVPQFLYYQSDLRVVHLSNINLKGDFPNWLLQNNTNLLRLNLANNSLQGHFEVPLLPQTSLSSLDISGNSIDGNVPTEIGEKLPLLWYLNMSRNHFHGSIPASIGDMNSLVYLDLSGNQLSGELPEHLVTGCSSLVSLTLSNNSLQGQMFSSKFNLTNLMVLLLDGNRFSGKIPDSLSKCSQLQTLDLSHNELSGEIPRWMGNMSSLSEIVMANNHIEGPFPMEFCHLDILLLDLSMNKISGRLPPCFSPSSITEVHLSRNKLEGPLTNVFRNSTDLVTLDLSKNLFTGKIPNWIGNLSQLSHLLLKNNHFEGGIPIQLCNLDHLSLIDLSNNNLSGTIPSCLKITTLNGTSQGYDAAPFAAAPMAEAPEPAVASLSIDEPIEFTSKNNSYSYKGRVLTYLSGIDLSCNKLTGEIPREVENFRNIYALNLSHNSLIGPIPVAFSDLKQIESLDLSHNNLSGTIPPQLVGLYSLSYFSVAYNNLSGSTPVMTAQFSTFEERSYVGNPLLCGKPLPKTCSPSGPSPSPSSLPKGSTGKGLMDMTAFYGSFVASYVVVIPSIASVLYINPYWRRAWFYHVGEISKRCYYFLEDHILPRRF